MEIFLSHSYNTPSLKKIYTIGYENKTPDGFYKLLSEKGIRHLVDVRTLPRSHRSEFGKKKLEVGVKRC